MPNIVVELHDGSLGPIELQTPPEKTAAAVLDACSRKFNRGVGSLSPKDNPKLLLEDGDVLAGGMAYVFTPSAGSQGMHHICHDSGYTMQTLLPHLHKALSRINVASQPRLWLEGLLWL